MLYLTVFFTCCWWNLKRCFSSALIQSWSEMKLICFVHYDNKWRRWLKSYFGPIFPKKLWWTKIPKINEEMSVKANILELLWTNLIWIWRHFSNGQFFHLSQTDFKCYFRPVNLFTPVKTIINFVTVTNPARKAKLSVNRSHWHTFAQQPQPSSLFSSPVCELHWMKFS